MKSQSAKWIAFAVLFSACGAEIEDAEISEDTSEVCTTAQTFTSCRVALWPGGIVHYGYSASITGNESTAGSIPALMRAAMDRWEVATDGAITFVLAPYRTKRLDVVLTPNSCSADIGYQTAKMLQTINIDSGCPMDHELGHVIGLWHEHQRQDRNRFIALDPSAPICNDGQEWMRCAVTEDSGQDLWSYDLTSTMQYNTGAGTPADITHRSDGTVVTEGKGALNARDAAKVMELYGRAFGPMTRFRSLGVEDAPLSPLRVTLASSVWATNAGPPALSRTTRSLVMAARGTDGRIYVRRARAFNPRESAPWTAMSAGAASTGGVGAGTFHDLTYLAHTSVAGDVYLTNENAQTGAFVAWSNLGRPSSRRITSTPALVGFAGTFYVFARGDDSALFYRRWLDTSGWGAWQRVGGVFEGTPSAAYRGNDQLDVFVNAGGQLFQTWTVNASQSTPTFNGWLLRDANARMASGTGPVAVSGFAGREDILYRGPHNWLYWKTWRSSSGWTTNKPLGGVLSSEIAAVQTWGSARFDVLTRGDDQGLWHRSHLPQASRPQLDRDGDGRDSSFSSPAPGRSVTRVEARRPSNMAKGATPRFLRTGTTTDEWTPPFFVPLTVASSRSPPVPRPIAMAPSGHLR